MKKLVLFLLLVFIPCSFGVTLEEVLDSYNFSYEDESFNLKKFELNNSLEINIDFGGNFGEYFFVLDFYNNDEFKFRYFNESYFSLENQSINLFVPLVFNYSNYDLHLEIYLEDELMYRNDFEVLISNLSISNASSNLLFFNESFDFQKSLRYVDFEELGNDKIETLIFNFESSLNDGNYLIDFYFGEEIFRKEILIKDNKFKIETNSSEIFELDEEIFHILKLVVYNESKVVDSVLIDEYIGPYFISDFVLPNLPDLIVVENNTEIYILNNGTLDSTNFSYKIVDNNLNILNESIINLKVNESYLLNINLSEFYVQIDFNNEVLESNEYNNIYFKTIEIYKYKNDEELNEVISSSSGSKNSNKKMEKTINQNISFIEDEFEIENISINNLSKDKSLNLNISKSFKEEISLNNISIKPNFEEEVAKVQELIIDNQGFLDSGFIAFIGSIFVSIFSIIFLLL